MLKFIFMWIKPRKKSISELAIIGFYHGLPCRVKTSQIACIGGPPKTRQFFRSHPPAHSQRIRWWDAGKMAIGLCHVPLAESAQTASGWASGHGRHAGGFRSRQARQWRATGVAPADFIRTRRSQAWPASSPTIHYTGCLNYSVFFHVSYSYLHFSTTDTLIFCGWSRSRCAWDVATTSGRRWRHNRKYENIIASCYMWIDFFAKLQKNCR